jgi:hypothetical protein
VAVTVTASVKVAGDTTSARSVRGAPAGNFCWLSANPGARTTSTRSPDGDAAIVKRPSSPVVTCSSRAPPRTVTDAPGTVPPATSRTVPLIGVASSPCVACADAQGHVASIESEINTREGAFMNRS